MISTRSLATASIAALVAGAASAETFVVTSPAPPSHWLNSEGIEPLMSCVKDRTGGQIEFNYFPSGQIASVQGSYDALNGGLAQIALVTTSSNSDKFPLNQITLLPNMGVSATAMVAAYRKILSEDGLMAKELAAGNIVPLSVIFTPPYQIGTAKDRIDSVEDFQGLKIRVSGGGQVFGTKSLDAVPVQIAGGDTYVAMQQGTVDGYMLSITSVSAYNLQELTGAISTNGRFTNTLTLFAMEKGKFDGLPEETRKVLVDCGLEIETNLVAYMEDLARQLEKDFAAAGVDVYQFSPELWTQIVDKMAPVTDDYMQQMAKLGLPGQQAYDEFRLALEH